VRPAVLDRGQPGHKDDVRVSISSRWQALISDLEASTSALRQELERSSGQPNPIAAERRAIERSLDRFQITAAAVTGYVDAYLRSIAPRPRR
jgi:hypothetical protein